MSAFLGPIHALMYQRISNQEALTQQMQELAERSGWCPGLQQQMHERFGAVDTRPLADIIDASNIHGWLSERVNTAEERLRATAEEILGADESCLPALKDLYYAFGTQHAVQSDDAQEAYRALDALLLDGMPCDRGRGVLGQGTPQALLWEYDPEKHPLCGAIGAIENPFGQLRAALLQGMLAGSGLRLEPMGAAQYKIEREEQDGRH